jgi:hypothetical protein
MAVRARWERAEAITLYPDTGNPAVLATHRRDVEFTVFSQRLFLPAPGGAHLAYQAGQALRLRDGRGREREVTGWAGGDFRFRADGRALCALAGPGNDRVLRSLSVDGDERVLADLGTAPWMECSADGVVAQVVDPANEGIAFVSWSGAVTRIPVGPWIARLMAHPSTPLVAWVAEGGVFAMHGVDGAPRALGKLPGVVKNGEMAPDGRSFTVATSLGVVRFTDGRAEVVSRDHDVHSLWYGPDGELAFASPDRAVVLRGKERLTLEGGPIAGMRLHRRDGGLLIARGSEALHWKPGRAPEVLATVPIPSALLGVDVFDGGLVLWSGGELRERRP